MNKFQNAETRLGWISPPFESSTRKKIVIIFDSIKSKRLLPTNSSRCSVFGRISWKRLLPANSSRVKVNYKLIQFSADRDEWIGKGLNIVGMANWPKEIPMKKSECQAIQTWTFNALVGAFLDLVIAYLLLCASTAAYLAEKFLSIFGLSLPCPCNGLFGFAESTCMQRELVDGPLEKISSVQTSVKNRFPFDLMWVHGEISEEKIQGGKHFEQKGEASYSSYSNEGGEDVSARESVLRNDKKRASNLKRRLGLRQRRRIVALYEKASSQDPLQSDAQELTSSSSRSDEETNQASLPQSISDSNNLKFPDDKDKDAVLEQSQSLDGSGRSIELVSEKLRKDWLQNIENEKDAVKLLKQALEVEHAARVALHLELEQERNAAASATDEALAMILRLQEEKASVEMEARQYQREIEEKSIYDAEEMNILKEILLRREREKHFLENELEVYKQAIFANEESMVDSDLNSTASTHEKGVSSFYSPEVLEQIKKALDKDITPNPTPVFDISCQGSGTFPIGDLYKLHFQEGKNEENEELEHEKVIMPVGEKQDQDGNPILSEGLASNFGDAKTMVPTNKDLADTAFDDAEVIVHDVHVSGDEPDSYNTENATSNVPSTVKTGPEINRSSSDLTSGLPPISEKGLVSILRRNSMSAVDYERMKIDNEVERLMERLKLVQMGKQKLKISAGDGDGGKTQLQLLHDIAIQLQEIKRWTYYGKNERQAALPPSSSKQVKSRKARSASVGVPPRST